ncbi:unnamed protein product [Blepharisma stoltei]|uniref:Uncharacterized protein n=1 Tax=Blepharisma stoltei TaxID=1481888 RepID=A0AAU9JQ26_9CILI|nr:unnamed protein product [Blepharisma stoltei]
MSFGIKCKKSQVKTHIFSNDQLPYLFENNCSFSENLKNKANHNRKLRSHSQLESIGIATIEKNHQSNWSFSEISHNKKRSFGNGDFPYTILSLLSKHRNLPVVKKLRAQAISALTPGSFLSKQIIREHNKTPKREPMPDIFMKNHKNKYLASNVSSVRVSPTLNDEKNNNLTEISGKMIKTYTKQRISKKMLLPSLENTQRISPSKYGRKSFKDIEVKKEIDEEENLSSIYMTNYGFN